MTEVFRKEIKYPISLLDFHQLQKRLECFVQHDQHSGSTGYRVRSLYFDSAGDRDLYDTLDGNMEKRKIRLRFYPPDTDYIRLEYKCKSGTDSTKRSFRVTKEDAECLVRGDYLPLLRIQDPLALELYGRIMTGGYQPRVVVEYNRMAYTYPVSNTRLNFDNAVAASYVTDSFFDANPGLVPLMPPDMGVLEVKYDHFLVAIIKEAVESVDSLSKANSKYAQARLII